MSLVATEDPGKFTDAMGPVSTFRDAADSAGQGDWVEGALNAGLGGLETLGVIADPLGGVLSAGIGWVLEHVQPVSDWFDELAGDPGQIKAFAETWQNVGADIRSNAETLRSTVAGDTSGWEGPAITAYRGAVGTQADICEGFGTMCSGIGGSVLIGGSIVASVRALVVEALADIVGVILKYTVPLLSGVGTAPALAAIGVKVSGWVSRLSKFIDDLLTSMGRLGQVLRQIGTAAEDAGRSIKQAADAFADMPINDGFDIANGALPSQAHVVYTNATQVAKDLAAANDD